MGKGRKVRQSILSIVRAYLFDGLLNWQVGGGNTNKEELYKRKEKNCDKGYRLIVGHLFVSLF